MPFINGRFYANPAHGRAIEAPRTADAASQHSGPGQQDDSAHWVTIDNHPVLIHEAQARPGYRGHAGTKPLPGSGQASIYADSFEGKQTANQETFHQNGYTAALLPRARWHSLPLGTRVELTHDGNRVVVEVNDRGAGDKDPHSTRTLDLSRAAASALLGQKVNNDLDSRKVGLIKLDKIRVVPADTPLGPVRP